MSEPGDGEQGSDEGIGPIPDAFEPVIAWRVWRLGREGLLRPLVSDGAWVPGKNAASCGSKRHRAPEPNCPCGFNALHQPPHE